MLVDNVTDYKVEITNYNVVKPFIKKWHYSHKTQGLKSKYSFGLFREGKFGLDEMIGAMIYALPAMLGPAEKYYPDNPNQVLELSRLCCIDDTLTNTESYFIGKTLQWLRRNTDYKVITSYADPEEGHEGVIYKATNFIHSGMTSSGRVLLIDGEKYHSRILTDTHSFAKHARERLNDDKDEDVNIIETEPKHIYVYYLDKKLRRKNNVGR